MQPVSNIRAYFICDLLDMFNADSSFGAHATFVTGLVFILPSARWQGCFATLKFSLSYGSVFIRKVVSRLKHTWYSKWSGLFVPSQITVRRVKMP